MNTQKMKMLLVACSTLFVSQVFAEDWFVRPDIVTTAGDGHSWEGALCVSDFQMLLANELATSGDIFHLAGGSYIPSSNAENFRITQGVKLIGGYAGNLKGTDTTLPVYPSATPTIFSGDRNNDGMPNAGDIQNLLVINSTDTVTVQGIEFRCAYYQGGDYGAGSVYTNLSNVVLKNCTFRDNTSTFHGGAGFTTVGSFTHLIDCAFTNNKAKSRGGAILVDNASAENGGRKSLCVLERCQLTDNVLEYNSTDGKYGAAIQIRHGNMWIINSTIANNKAYCNGAGISVSDGDTVRIVSSTLANNVCTRVQIDLGKPNSYGSSIRMEKEAVLYIANSISLEGPEDVGDKRNPTCYTENYTKGIENYFISGGYNYVGTFYDLTKKYQDPVWNTVWKTTDQPGTPVDVHVYADMFGTNELADNGGGTYTIMPVSNTAGASLTDLQSIFAQWKCPVDVAFNRDQRGYVRKVNSSIGAIDVSGTVGLNITTKEMKRLVELSPGRYFIEGATNIRVFGINGSLLLDTKGETVDLSDLAKGVYLLKTDGVTYKVLR